MSWLLSQPLPVSTSPICFLPHTLPCDWHAFWSAQVFPLPTQPRFVIHVHEYVSWLWLVPFAALCTTACWHVAFAWQLFWPLRQESTVAHIGPAHLHDLRHTRATAGPLPEYERPNQ